MDAEEAAHSVAGAVGVIDARLPQILPRQHVELAAAGALGKHCTVNLDVAFQHAGETVAHFSGRLARADPHGAGDVGGAAGILPARIDEVDRTRRDRDIAVLVHLVMRQRGVAGGSGDGVEGKIAQPRIAPAEFGQLGGGGKLVHTPQRRFDFQPAQEPAHRRPVAHLRIAVALLFGGVLDRLGKDRRVLFEGELRAARTQRLRDADHREIGIEADALARKLAGQRAFEGVAITDGHRIAEVARQFGRHLLGRDEQLGAAVLVGDDIGQGDGGVRHVGTADIEQPCDRIERRDNHRVMPVLHQPVGHGGALFGRGASGQIILVNQRRGGRGCGAIGPDRVDRVAFGRHKGDALGLNLLFQRLDPGPGVEPRIIGDFRAGLAHLGKPCAEAVGRHAFVCEQIAVHLLAHLHGVSPVDEDRRVVQRHRGKARRTAETRQPVQALGIIADIFAHMFIADRHDETVHPAPLQFLAQGGKAGFMGLHQHGKDPRVSVRSTCRAEMYD